MLYKLGRTPRILIKYVLPLLTFISILILYKDNQTVVNTNIISMIPFLLVNFIDFVAGWNNHATLYIKPYSKIIKIDTPLGKHYVGYYTYEDYGDYIDVYKGAYRKCKTYKITNFNNEGVQKLLDQHFDNLN
jgi:hypothetical protein